MLVDPRVLMLSISPLPRVQIVYLAPFAPFCHSSSEERRSYISICVFHFPLHSDFLCHPPVCLQKQAHNILSGVASMENSKTGLFASVHQPKTGIQKVSI